MTVIVLRSLLMCILVSITPHVSAEQESGKNTPEDVVWNLFVDNLHKLHKHITSKLPIRTEEEIGGYGGSLNNPKYYRELRYYNTNNNRLMSKIQWERKNPKIIHTIELYIYDTAGRAKREYQAAFLPGFRNAPIQTLINFYSYNGQLRGFRQFDASGNRIYEHCTGIFSSENVDISLDDYELSRSALDQPKIMSSKAYLSCFEGLATQVGEYSNPLAEIPNLKQNRQ